MGNLKSENLEYLWPLKVGFMSMPICLWVDMGKFWGLKNIEPKMTFYSNHKQNIDCHVCLKSSEQTLRNPNASKLETSFDRRDQDSDPRSFSM